MNHDLKQLFKASLELQERSLDGFPPANKWKTPLCGDIDILVDREGKWIHEGREIKRSALVKMFSSLLVREDNEYYIVTPEEKWRITVELAPLYVIDVQRIMKSGDQAIVFSTRTNEHVVLSKDNPIRIDYSSNSREPIPLVIVRNNMPALLSRSVFYQIISWAYEAGSPPHLFIDSMGKRFGLGATE